MRAIRLVALFGALMLLGVPALAQVVDVTPPEIVSAISDPGYLWPPNHKMIEVKISAIVTDDTDAAPTLSIISVESSEPETDADDGEEVTTPDWEIVDATTVDLRAERTGKNDGRIYTVTIEASDAAGNTSTEEIEILVPHDQGDMRLYRHQVKAQQKLYKQQEKAARKAAKEELKNSL